MPNNGLIFVWLFIYLFLPVILVLVVVGVVIFCVVRSVKMEKKAQLQDMSSKDEALCLNCGAVIDSKKETCQMCGWTWK